MSSVLCFYLIYDMLYMVFLALDTLEVFVNTFQVKEIGKTYNKGKKIVLSDITFKVNAGECVGILGANGCGKTTLLSILAGVQNANKGSILIDGIPLTKNNSFENIAYVPQENPLMEELTARDNLRLWYTKSKLDMAWELENGVLGMLGIPDFLDTKVCQMSGGMKKRLSIGCAIAQDPQILILDEPGAALDLPCKERIAVYIQNCKKKGKMILIATHEEREIEMCDTCYIMKEGKLQEYVYDGNIHTLAGKLV